MKPISNSEMSEEKTFAYGQTAKERMRMTLELIALRDTDLTPESLAAGVLREIGHWKADAEPVPERKITKMTKPLKTITQNVNVGIYDNCEQIFRIYSDKIIAVLPYVKWVGNTGGYAERKIAIRDPEIVAAVVQDIKDDCEDSAIDKLLDHIDYNHL